jgi:hypothetical protein
MAMCRSVAPALTAGRGVGAIHNRLRQVLPWDQVEYRVSDLGRCSEQRRRRKGQDEGEGVCEDHCRCRYSRSMWCGEIDVV